MLLRIDASHAARSYWSVSTASSAGHAAAFPNDRI